MNPDERTLLSCFLGDLVAARAGSKDADADAMIRQALSANPDAAYLLVQHAIVADQSLHAAQQRIADLERQQQPAPSPSSFLPQNSSGPWGSRQTDAYGYAPPAPGERPSILSGGGGLSSFLRTAGTTAAGVAGGEMLFSGLSDLFGHHGGGLFGGGGQGFMDAPEEVTINNFGDGGSDDGFDDSN